MQWFSVQNLQEVLLYFFFHRELLNSTMEDKQTATLISSIGNLKTLTMTFIFKLSDTKVNGRIRMCSVLNEASESIYKYVYTIRIKFFLWQLSYTLIEVKFYRLNLTKMKVKSVVGLCIVGDNYRVDHIINEFTDASITLMYRRDNKMVPVYNKIQAKHISTFYWSKKYL